MSRSFRTVRMQSICFRRKRNIMKKKKDVPVRMLPLPCWRISTWHWLPTIRAIMKMWWNCAMRLRTWGTTFPFASMKITSMLPSITVLNLCLRFSIPEVRNMISGERTVSLPGFPLSWDPVTRTLLQAATAGISLRRNLWASMKKVINGRILRFFMQVVRTSTGRLTRVLIPIPDIMSANFWFPRLFHRNTIRIPITLLCTATRMSC